MSARRPRHVRGFTLLEVMVALTVLTSVVVFTYQILQNSVRGQQMVREGLERPRIENAILGQIFRDLRYLYWDGFSGNAGFVGHNRDLSGMRADTIDFVTSRPSRFARSDEQRADDSTASPLTEVGYALRPNEENGDYLELWRREDWFVDSDPTSGGRYSLIYDKITRFDITYFEVPEEQTTDRGAEEWDSRVKGRLPYAIVLEIDFDVGTGERANEEEDQGHVTRIILLKGAYDVKRSGTGPGTTPGDGTPAPGNG